MNTIELIIISLGLGTDAFAASICKGTCIRKMNLKKALVIGMYFGISQAIMPIIGYILAEIFIEGMSNLDNIIAFIALCAIGIKMIKDSTKNEKANDNISIKKMVPLSIATSLDALAVGISFALLKINIIHASIIIGIITFIMTSLGAALGSKLGKKFGKMAEKLGGVVLIAAGIKTLLEEMI